jgi:hypothetical protein
MKYSHFSNTQKLFGLIKMCLNETCITVRVSRYQSDKFSVQNGLKEGDFVTIAFHLCFQMLYYEGSRRLRRNEIEWDTSDFCLF